MLFKLRAARLENAKSGKSVEEICSLKPQRKVLDLGLIKVCIVCISVCNITLFQMHGCYEAPFLWQCRMISFSNLLTTLKHSKMKNLFVQF